eukprot:SAG31_NODE_471_length_15238_cov_14.684554_9_plen_238_part_00
MVAYLGNLQCDPARRELAGAAYKLGGNSSGTAANYGEFGRGIQLFLSDAHVPSVAQESQYNQRLSDLTAVFMNQRNRAKHLLVASKKSCPLAPGVEESAPEFVQEGDAKVANGPKPSSVCDQHRGHSREPNSTMLLTDFSYFLEAKSRTRHWLDALVVDSTDLIAHGVRRHITSLCMLSAAWHCVELSRTLACHLTEVAIVPVDFVGERQKETGGGCCRLLVCAVEHENSLPVPTLC